MSSWYSPTVFYVVSLLLSTAYFINPTVYCKPLPIWALGILALKSNNTYGKLIATGLLFGSFGDILLDLDDHAYPNAGFFIYGLASFLVSHLFYVRAFWSCGLSFDNAHFVFAIALVYYYSIMKVLLPNMQRELVGPVLVYGLVISSMIFLAFMRFFSPETCGKGSKFRSLIGSLVFLVSDSILAVNKFAGPVENAHIYVMITYYVGQTFLAASTYHSESSTAKKED